MKRDDDEEASRATMRDTTAPFIVIYRRRRRRRPRPRRRPRRTATNSRGIPQPSLPSLRHNRLHPDPYISSLPRLGQLFNI